MRSFSATDAGFAGFRIVRDNPLILVVWTLVTFAFLIAVVGAVVLLVGSRISALSTVGDTPSTAQVESMISTLAPVFILVVPLALLYSGVIMAAINRAVLRPQEKGFFYLRLGADEFRQAVVMLIQLVSWLGLYLVCALVVMLSVLIGAAVDPKAGALAAIPGGLLAVGVFVFFSVRFSLMGAMTFYGRKIDVFGSWTLTRGRFWPMLGAFLLAFVFYLMIYAVLFIGQLSLTAGVVGANPGVAIVGGLVFAVVYGVLATLMNLVLAGPAPTIFKAIGTTEPAAVFD